MGEGTWNSIFLSLLCGAGVRFAKVMLGILSSFVILSGGVCLCYGAYGSGLWDQIQILGAFCWLGAAIGICVLDLWHGVCWIFLVIDASNGINAQCNSLVMIKLNATWV